MLIFCHLCIGAIIGLFLARRTGNTRMVALAAIGSILPDLVDKPLGYFVYGDILGHGRFYLHTLLFLLLLAGLGAFVLYFYRSCLVALVAGLVGLHQVMDLMWLTPVTWFYPFMGAPPVEIPVELGGWLFAIEVESLSEWVFLGVLLLIVLAVLHRRQVLPFGALALLVLGIAAVAGLSGLPLHLVPDNSGETGLMFALVSFAGFLGLWLYDRIGREEGAIGGAVSSR